MIEIIKIIVHVNPGAFVMAPESDEKLKIRNRNSKTEINLKFIKLKF